MIFAAGLAGKTLRLDTCGGMKKKRFSRKMRERKWEFAVEGGGCAVVEED